MAHELEVQPSGTASFVSARIPAWHRVGTVLPAEFDAAAAMTHAKLGGWNVRKETLQTVVVGAQGVDTLDVPGKFATVRTSPHSGRPEVLGVVGDQYVPIQNEDHTDLLDALVDESGAHFETAGSLKGGRQVFVTMKLPTSMQIGGIDPVDTYLAAMNSHDGSSAFRLIVSPVRVVCANTQAAAIRRARASFSIHHTIGAKGQIQVAREALGLTFRYVEAFQSEADRLIDQTMTDAQFAAMVGELWPVDTTATDRSKNAAAQRSATLTALFTESPTNTAIRGTRWAGYQAVTEYLHHVAPVKGADDASAARAARVLAGGTTTDLKVRAFDLLAA